MMSAGESSSSMKTSGEDELKSHSDPFNPLDQNEGRRVFLFLFFLSECWGGVCVLHDLWPGLCGHFAHLS